MSNEKNIIKLVYLFLMYAHVIFSVNKPILLHIHGITKEVQDIASCDKSTWNNKASDACECCLLETQASDSTKTADEIIQICKDAKLCSDASLAKLKKDNNILNGTSQQLLDILYNDAVVIRSMTFDTNLLQPNGSFTESSLPQFLAQAFDQKKLNNPDFSKAACLKAKNLGTQGGYNTLQLFLVTSTCRPSQASMYIIKEARDGLDEATKLKEIENLPRMKEIIAPQVIKDLPTIALPIAYFSYPDKSALHYIAAMPAAKGKPLSDLIIMFRDNQTPQNTETLNRAFHILGKETSNFHKRFMNQVSDKIIGNTMAHGDFHFFNLFFDEIGGHFTWIDNETMAKSMLNKVSPSVDFVKLFFMPFSLNRDYKQFWDLIKGIDLQVWFDVALKNFVIGYADAYKQGQRKQVLEELKQLFNAPFTIAWVDFNDNQLDEIRTKYINPIFDALINPQSHK